MITGTTTLTTKGQAVIPKPIRDKLGLQPSDQLRFRLEGSKIVVEKVVPLLNLQGSIPKKTFTRQQEKQAISDQTISKFRQKNT